MLDAKKAPVKSAYAKTVTGASNRESDYKPGSVPLHPCGWYGDCHSSRSTVTCTLKQPTRKLTAAICFLFGLASSGVYMCPACYQPGGSLLHCPSTLTCLLSQTGGIFLLHCPWSRLRQTLSGTLPCEARTFLSCGLSVSQQRPSVLLTTMVV